MPKVSIDIPEKLVEEHAATKIKQLEDKEKRMQRKIDKLEDEAHKLKNDKELCKSILTGFQCFIDEYAYERVLEDW